MNEDVYFLTRNKLYITCDRIQDDQLLGKIRIYEDVVTAAQG